VNRIAETVKTFAGEAGTTINSLFENMEGDSNVFSNASFLPVGETINNVLQLPIGKASKIVLPIATQVKEGKLRDIVDEFFQQVMDSDDVAYLDDVNGQIEDGAAAVEYYLKQAVEHYPEAESQPSGSNPSSLIPNFNEKKKESEKILSKTATSLGAGIGVSFVLSLIITALAGCGLFMGEDDTVIPYQVSGALTQTTGNPVAMGTIVAPKV